MSGAGLVIFCTSRVAAARGAVPAMAKDQDDRSDSANLAMVGLQVAVGVALGFVVGSWLDRKFGWAPKGVVIGSLVGLAGGLYLLIKDAIRINKQ